MLLNESEREPATPSAGEIGWMVLITVAAGVVRFLYLSAEGISHFDEGVYVLGGTGAGYPMEEFYSPPLFPMLLRIAFAVLGTSDLAAKALSAAVGTATVPLVWWLARRWYGPVAAAACVPQVAFSSLHVMMSRMALTDACFSFLVVLALWLISEVLVRCCQSNAATGAFEGIRGSIGWKYLATPVAGREVGGRLRGLPWAIGAGLAAGAAMNTKYNGFLVLVIAAGSLVCCATRPAFRREIDWRRFPFFLAVAGAIAIALYVPWYLHVQQTYGYSRLLAHHRGYTAGLSSWASNLWTFAQEQSALTGSVGWVGPLLGVLAAYCVSRRAIGALALALAGLATLAGLAVGDAAMWLLGPIFLAAAARQRGPVVAIHVVWLIGLFLLTPIYRPYVRLLLPLSAAGWIAFGGFLASVLERPGLGDRQTASFRAWPVFGVVCISILALIPLVRSVRPDASSKDVPTLQLACESVLASMPPDEPVFCIVRPPVLVYIGAHRQVRLLNPDVALGLVADAVPRERLVLLVDRALVRDNPRLGERLKTASDRLHERVRVAYWPGLRVTLDDFGRDAVRPESVRSVRDNYELVMYVIQPNDE